jgi:hypothetical protein
MEQSLPNFAREALYTLKNSFIQGRRGGYYAQMDQESEDEQDDMMDHSLFYSVHETNNNINEDSIPLTLSNAYSDRSQLLFEQQEEEHELLQSSYSQQEEDYEESPVRVIRG